MRGLSLKEENIIKDIRNLFRSKKEPRNYTTINEIFLDKKQKLKQLKIEYFLSMKKKKIIINQ